MLTDLVQPLTTVHKKRKISLEFLNSLEQAGKVSIAGNILTL